jgi:hypothetical protein
MKTNREDANQIFVGLLEAVGIDTHKGEFFVEEWRPIKYTNDMYEVSDMGGIRSWYDRGGKRAETPRMMSTTTLNDRGYVIVRLKINGKTTTKKLHRLIAETWLPNPENKPQVNHKDGDKTNNHLSNLEWMTGSENVVHAYDNGIMARGKEHVHCIYGLVVIKDGIEITTLYGLSAWKAFGLSSGSVYRVLMGVNKTHKGYTFRKEPL